MAAEEGSRGDPEANFLEEMDLPFNQEIVLEKVMEVSWDKEASSVASDPLAMSIRSRKDAYGEGSQATGGRKVSGAFERKRTTSKASRNRYQSVNKGRFGEIVESMISQEEDNSQDQESMLLI